MTNTFSKNNSKINGLSHREKAQQNPLLIDPLNYPTCDVLDRQWHSSLKDEWNNCITVENPIYENTLQKEKKKLVNEMCCKEVMQCIHPNKWFEKNLPGYSCPEEKKPQFPHFGDTRRESRDEKLSEFSLYTGVL